MKYFLPIFLLISINVIGQEYYTKKYEPFNEKIKSPEEFLGYPIGSEHTRHDNIINYFEELANNSDRAILKTYGKTHEGRKLVMLVISSPENLNNIEEIQKKHLSKYQLLRKTKNGLAIVKVEKNTCQGCRIALTTAELQKIIQLKDLIQCKMCNRILYVS